MALILPLLRSKIGFGTLSAQLSEMSGAVDMTDNRLAIRAVLIASTMGIVFVLIISLFNGSLFLDEERSSATRLGAISFPIVFLAPFVVLAASCRLQDAGQRRAIWFGCLLSTLVLAILAIFSVGLLFLLIALAIFWAWLVTAQDEPTTNWLSPLLALWIVVTFGSSLLFPLFRPDTPACWTTDGWERTEGHATGILTISSNTGTCSSDITDSVEGAVALGAIALGILGIIAILRLWQADHRQPPAERRLTRQLNPK